jgi:hypothetical protein
MAPTISTLLAPPLENLVTGNKSACRREIQSRFSQSGVMGVDPWLEAFDFLWLQSTYA